jgi:hypothetical protein
MVLVATGSEECIFEEWNKLEEKSKLLPCYYVVLD